MEPSERFLASLRFDPLERRPGDLGQALAGQQSLTKIILERGGPRADPLGQTIAAGFSAGTIAPRHKDRNCHENGPRESCGPLDWTILHRISARTTL